MLPNSLSSSTNLQQSTLTHWNALCLKNSFDLLIAMLVLDLRSWVLLVTLAQISPWLSTSMMIRFFDSCSWIKMTWSMYLKREYERNK